MSLEDAIRENTHAVRALTEALVESAGQIEPAQPESPDKAPPKRSKPAKTEKAEKPVKEAEPEKEEEPVKESAPVDDGDDEAPPAKRSDVSKLVMDLCKMKNVGRDPVVAVLAEFDAKKVSQIKESDLGAIYQRLKGLEG